MMATTKIRQAARAKALTAVQPGDRLPLGDVEITYHREPHFIGEEGDVPVTISGDELGRVLHWMSRDAPGHPTRFSEAQYLASKVRAVGFLCRMVASSDRVADPDEVEPVMWLLGDLLDDYATRMKVQGEDAGKMLDKAHITIAKATAGKAVA
jgi:hypothetical protein